MRIWLVLIMAGGVACAAGCAGSDDDDSGDSTGTPGVIDCKTDTTTYDDVSMFDQCMMCHSSGLMGAAARHDAPANINFDTFEMASAIAKNALPEVKAGVMPPPKSGVVVTDAQKQKFYAWVECGLKK